MKHFILITLVFIYSTPLSARIQALFHPEDPSLTKIGNWIEQAEHSPAQLLILIQTILNSSANQSAKRVVPQAIL
jgi:hypothetical protein